jgi:sulfopyruvate decarboxylase TPP-binding subunit
MTGDEFVAVVRRLRFSHVILIPDSEIGRWEPALQTAQEPTLIRPTREGEGIGIAAGLMLGGKRPLVVIQCTGLFEAGDALRNVVHDLKLPLRLIVGVRSYLAYSKGHSIDSCPVFTEPILRAWQIPYEFLPPQYTPLNLETALNRQMERGTAGAVLIPE